MATDPRRNKRIAGAAALATAIAVPAEGLRQVAYFDPPGILTVCRGHTGADVQAGRRYTLAECDALLTADMRKAVEQVERCAPNLPEPVLAAFSDAAFNLGPTIVCSLEQSTAARLLHAGDIAGACAQLSRWDRARVGGLLVPLPGLAKRRAAERALCESAL